MCFVTQGVVGHSLRCLMKDLGDSIDRCSTEETENLSWKSDENIIHKFAPEQQQCNNFSSKRKRSSTFGNLAVSFVFCLHSC